MCRFFIHSFPYLFLFFFLLVRRYSDLYCDDHVQHVNFPERVPLDEKGWIVPGKTTNYRVAKQHSSLTLLYHSGSAVEYYVSHMIEMYLICLFYFWKHDNVRMNV